MTGNVWEWTADGSRRTRTPETAIRTRETVARHASRRARRLVPGHASYCRRYRVAARNALTPDSSSSNVGFRCVAL
jgi:formylglycine-generating enzyme required for sulfatase activity